MSVMNLVKELREKSGAGIMDCKKALTECENDVEKAMTWLREKGIASAGKKAGRIAAEGLTRVAIDGNYGLICEINAETDFVAKNEMFLSLVDTVASALLSAKPASLEEAMKIDVEGEDLETYMATKQAIIGEKLTLRRFELVEKTDGQVFGDYLHQGGKIGVLSLLNGDNYECARECAMQVAAMGAKFARREDVDQASLDAERDVLRTQALNEGRPENIVDKMVEGRIRKYYEEVCLTEQKYFKDTDKTMAQYASSFGCEIVSFVAYTVGEGIEKKEDNFVEEVMSQAGLK